MNSQEEIAVVGFSGLFPEAEGVDDFYRNLRDGLDSVRPIPDERMINSCVDSSRDYQVVGCLNRIDEFDHEFFNISLREAEYMDPHQRLALQLACAAVENAGYGLKEFRGSRTAVVLGNSLSSYYRLFKQFDPTALSGNMPAGLAGRIAYLLDLRGPAMTVETACSSSLVAVHEACQKLLAGDVDCALAGGISLNIFFPEKTDGRVSVGIHAPDGRSKTFDAAANGTGAGEGGGIVVLKLLRRALADGDHVHAVIKGSAVNQDGGRSNGLTAPSPSAQTEVITDAWARAGVEPRTVSYIEAHGTGTKLGDPIEIQGITDAFRSFTADKKFCAVGSVKTNIGHLDSAAGIAGLIKVIFSLKHRELFPSLHFVTPNPFIDFENTAVYVNTKLRRWETDGARRAGVSSFGLSGTNAHVVLEEAPPAFASRREGSDGGERLCKLSAKTPAALRRYMRSLLDSLEGEPPTLEDISYTLCVGRDDHPYRFACVVSSTRELAEELRRALSAEPISEEAKGRRAERPLVFLFSREALMDEALSASLAEGYEVFRRATEECRASARGAEVGGHVAQFVRQYALHKLCESFGLKASKVIGAGVGNVVTAVVTGRLTLAQGLAEASAYRDSGEPLNVEKLRAVVGDLSKDALPAFLELGQDGDLAREIEGLGGGGAQRPSVFRLLGGAGPLHTLARLYVGGVTVEWPKLYEGREGRRVPLPTYPFEKTRCWVTEPLKDFKRAASGVSAPAAQAAAAPAVAASTNGEAAVGTRERLLAIWGEVLKVDGLRVDDDYFDIGGNSLIGTQILTRIEQSFGVKLDFEVFYDYPTVEQLAGYIERAGLVPPSPAAPGGDGATREEVARLLNSVDEEAAAALLAELLAETDGSSLEG